MIHFLLCAIVMVSQPETADTPGFPRVSPMVKAYLGADARGRAALLLHDPSLGAPDGDFAPVTIRVATPADGPKLLKIAQSHVVVRRRNRRIVHVGTIYAAWVDARGVKVLDRTPWVVRVELDTRAPILPLELTRELVDVPAWEGIGVHERRAYNRGAGLVIGDIDSGMDPFHPAFFDADGGFFEWVDVDGDGRLTPGVDGVDLDGDGTINGDPAAGRCETFGLLSGIVYQIFSDVPVPGDWGQTWSTYRAGMDYLYIDENCNGAFDQPGTGDGATYGEPIFVGDDLDGDGALSPWEKVVRLSSPKVVYYFDGHSDYTPENMTDLDVSDFDTVMHGTSVAHILAGGQPGFHRLVGMAPAARIAMAGYWSAYDQGMLVFLDALTSFGVDVVLHEYGQWTGEFLDGSSNFEQAMDQLSAQGIPQVNPAGNLGGSAKEAKVVLPAGDSTDMVAVMPSDIGGYGVPYYVEITFLWRTGDVHVTLTLPGGQEVSLEPSGQQVISGTDLVYEATSDTSPRGTHKLHVYMFGYDSHGNYTSVPDGTWTFSVENRGSEEAVVHGFLMDAYSGWGMGFYWDGPIVTEEHLVTWPGTADSAITVAAYTGHGTEDGWDVFGDESGSLRSYSGRGHRIDGEPIMDVAAPSNPAAAACLVCTQERRYGVYSVFGGTSGAGPHVAGIAALVKEAHPTWTGTEVRQAIREGAVVDSFVQGDGVLPVEDLWGAGKVDAFGALHGGTPDRTAAPSIREGVHRVQLRDGMVRVCDASETFLGSVEPQAEYMRIDWDYDGTFDGTGGGSAFFTLDQWSAGVEAGSVLEAMAADGTVLARVEMANWAGDHHFDVLMARVVESCTDDSTPGGDSTDTSGTADGTDHDGGGCSCTVVGAQHGGPWQGLILIVLVVGAAWSMRKRTGQG